MVGLAVCREILNERPARLVVSARREFKARAVVDRLAKEYPDLAATTLAVWGDVFLRAEWQGDNARQAVLADPQKRRRLIADIIEPLNEEIVDSSFLVQSVLGSAPGLGGLPSQIIVDCMNTATAVSYQDIYGMARHLAQLSQANDSKTDWPTEIETLLASLSLPQLVRHVQLLYEAMRRAGTEAYVKVGTSGSGGMGFNIPFTHGEEKPSRLILSKSSMAGAQTLLNFLMARTPDAPAVVKEIKPTAMIGWNAIDYGPIVSRGKPIELYDCDEQHAVSIRRTENLANRGDFGKAIGKTLVGVYIDTGENGKFSASEFSVITSIGMMALVTPEEVARNAVRELRGTATGYDVVAALDGSVLEPSYRGAYLRQAALEKLRQLETRNGEAVAFENLGPPRLSKLLFEAYLLKRVCKTHQKAVDSSPEELALALEGEIKNNAELRQRILSIGVPILLADGERLLRGPVIKSKDAYHGWVELTESCMREWQTRLCAIRETINVETDNDTSSRRDRLFNASRQWRSEIGFPDIGEIAAWILINEDKGVRNKN